MRGLTFTYKQLELCSTTTPADCVAPLGACTQQLHLSTRGKTCMKQEKFLLRCNVLSHTPSSVLWL